MAPNTQWVGSIDDESVDPQDAPGSTGRRSSHAASTATPIDDWASTGLHDTDGVAHYVIRPDRQITYRAARADLIALHTYLPCWLATILDGD